MGLGSSEYRALTCQNYLIFEHIALEGATEHAVVYSYYIFSGSEFLLKVRHCKINFYGLFFGRKPQATNVPQWVQNKFLAAVFISIL